MRQPSNRLLLPPPVQPLSSLAPEQDRSIQPPDDVCDWRQIQQPLLPPQGLRCRGPLSLFNLNPFTLSHARLFLLRPQVQILPQTPASTPRNPPQPPNFTAPRRSVNPHPK